MQWAERFTGFLVADNDCIALLCHFDVDLDKSSIWYVEYPCAISIWSWREGQYKNHSQISGIVSFTATFFLM